MVKHGIDVSKFQGLIDWQEVKKHIDFAIIKFKEKLNITMPILYDVKHLYENEYEVGIYALNLIKEMRMNVHV